MYIDNYFYFLRMCIKKKFKIKFMRRVDFKVRVRYGIIDWEWKRNKLINKIRRDVLYRLIIILRYRLRSMVNLVFCSWGFCEIKIKFKLEKLALMDYVERKYFWIYVVRENTLCKI